MLFMGKSTFSMAIFYVANCKRLPVAGVVGILRTYWLMGRLNRGIYQLFYLRSLVFLNKSWRKLISPTTGILGKSLEHVTVVTVVSQGKGPQIPMASSHMIEY